MSTHSREILLDILCVGSISRTRDILLFYSRTHRINILLSFPIVVAKR